MKKILILILTLVLFISINTQYYWERFLGLWAFPIGILLFFLYISLGFILIYQLFYLFKEKFKSLPRLVITIVMIIVLVLVYFKPLGIIDYEKYEGKDLLIAQREGAANSTTTLKLKDNNTFKERNVCFGVDIKTGSYSIKNDTIFFINLSQSKNNDYYQFAILKKTKSNNKKIIEDIFLYKNNNDTLPNVLWVIKNDIVKTIKE